MEIKIKSIPIIMTSLSERAQRAANRAQAKQEFGKREQAFVNMSKRIFGDPDDDADRALFPPPKRVRIIDEPPAAKVVEPNTKDDEPPAVEIVGPTTKDELFALTTNTDVIEYMRYNIEQYGIPNQSADMAEMVSTYKLMQQMCMGFQKP